MKQLTFEIKPDYLALLDKNMNFVVEPGEFLVMAAASSEQVKLKKKFLVVAPLKLREAKEKKGKIENMKAYLPWK